MRVQIRCLILCWLGAWLPCLCWAGPALTICKGDEDSYPWEMVDRKGLLTILLDRVERRVDGHFKVVAKPWKRCQLEVESGAVDAAYKASFSRERLARGMVFPMLDHQPDADLRLMTDSYSLYRRKGSGVRWDGSALHCSGPVGAQTGFSVVAQLRAMGLKVEDGNRSALFNLEKLAAGRFEAVALQTQEGDLRLREHPELSSVIERVSPVLVDKPFYLVFSTRYFAGHDADVRDIWAAIAQERESAEYRQIVKTFR